MTFTVEVVANDAPRTTSPNIAILDYHPRDGYAQLVVEARSHGEAARLTARRVSDLDDGELIAVTADGTDYRYYTSDGKADRW